MQSSFHQHLDQIQRTVSSMAELVGRAMEDATTALLSADLNLAEQVIYGDAEIDRIYHRIEDDAFELLARHQPVARDLRVLVASLRVVVDVERMGDLATHIAKVTRLRYPAKAVPDQVHDLVRDMGRIAHQMAIRAANVLRNHDVAEARRLAEEDDTIDALHRELFRVLLSDDWRFGVEPAIDVTLIGRYYERFADHAVTLGNRVVYLVTGELPLSGTSDTS